jgi:hypothetical protein
MNRVWLVLRLNLSVNAGPLRTCFGLQLPGLPQGLLLQQNRFLHLLGARRRRCRGGRRQQNLRQQNLRHLVHPVRRPLQQLVS